MAGNVEVTGPDGGPYQVEFKGVLADTDVAQLTASSSGFTVGTGSELRCRLDRTGRRLRRDDVDLSYQWLANGVSLGRRQRRPDPHLHRAGRRRRQGAPVPGDRDQPDEPTSTSPPSTSPPPRSARRPWSPPSPRRRRPSRPAAAPADSHPRTASLDGTEAKRSGLQRGQLDQQPHPVHLPVATATAAPFGSPHHDRGDQQLAGAERRRPAGAGHLPVHDHRRERGRGLAFAPARFKSRSTPATTLPATSRADR